jgi:excisionase family DNA binding protein
MASKLLTTAAVAKRLGLTVNAVQKMIQAGRLEAVKAGRDYLIEVDSLDTITRKTNAGRPPKSKKSPPAKKSAKRKR